jgi:hypothetical protein
LFSTHNTRQVARPLDARSLGVEGHGERCGLVVEALERSGPFVIAPR